MNDVPALFLKNSAYVFFKELFYKDWERGREKKRTWFKRKNYYAYEDAWEYLNKTFKIGEEATDLLVM